ncbi:hypothetical protein HMPREF1619_03879 [Klebsiella pneumoniae 909957]|nr:hypothetical protein HMPREF9538_01052 [Klebsiella sp. MS 92-3]ESA99943.1 hypothetical protein HMPREF1619_03879 [Klebsiella pneumoniae 909957]
MPYFHCGYSLMIRGFFGRNADEKQPVDRFDVSIPWRCDGA